MTSFAQGLLERHLSRPLHAYAERLKNRVTDLTDLLDSPAALDQYPGRRVPGAYSRRFGPISLTTPRRSDDAGFESLATVATPATPHLPVNGNILVDRRGAFRWMETQITTYWTWTWSSAAGTPPASKRTFAGAGDILDPAFPQNGGAMLMNRNMFVGDPANATVDDTPNAAFDIGLYDKKRGRYLHDGDRLPSAVFSGQNFCNRANPEGMRLDVGSELEPHLFVNEVRIANYLNTDALFNAAQVRVWVFVTLIGAHEQR